MRVLSIMFLVSGLVKYYKNSENVEFLEIMICIIGAVLALYQFVMIIVDLKRYEKKMN